MHRPTALLIVRPRLLRDIFRHLLERESGIPVVRELSYPLGLFEAIEESNAAIVVQAFDREERQQAQTLCRHLLECFPEIAVVSVDVAREMVSLSSSARAGVRRRFASIREVIAAVRLCTQPSGALPGEFAGASVEQFVDSPR